MFDKIDAKRCMELYISKLANHDIIKYEKLQREMNTSWFKLIKKNIEKGCFKYNVSLMDHYDLKLLCKKLDIPGYSNLSKSEMIARIKKKKENAATIWIHKIITFAPTEIENLILKFVDFLDEDINHQRYEEIRKAQYIYFTIGPVMPPYAREDLFDWFQKTPYYPIESLLDLTQLQLLVLYIHEWDKIVCLKSFPVMYSRKVVWETYLRGSMATINIQFTNLCNSYPKLIYNYHVLKCKKKRFCNCNTDKCLTFYKCLHKMIAS